MWGFFCRERRKGGGKAGSSEKRKKRVMLGGERIVGKSGVLHLGSSLFFGVGGVLLRADDAFMCSHWLRRIFSIANVRGCALHVGR